jgi:phosphoglycerate dehydrogenase-like enzyme
MSRNADFRSVSPSKEVKSSPPVTRKPVGGSIGFIGLGHMGRAMAANLAAGGRAVIGYLRQHERNAELEALGIADEQAR